MKEWKLKQEIYHRLNKDFEDDLSKHDVIISDNIVDNAVRYFTEKDIGWIYPAKSYMVGICYSKWLSKNFGDRPLVYLDDQNLLYNNDPYFISYSKDSYSYIKILEKIGGWDFDESAGMVPDVKKYFEQEFML